VWDKTERHDGSLGRSDFIWDAEADRFVCPAGMSLLRYRRPFRKPRSEPPKYDIIPYRAIKHDCDVCDYKPRCCPKTPQRKVTRSIYESSREVARTIATTESDRQSRKDRRKVEMLFAHLKRTLKLDRLRLRGMNGARDEFLLAATAQNLRRMAKRLGQPPPMQGEVMPA